MSDPYEKQFNDLLNVLRRCEQSLIRDAAEDDLVGNVNQYRNGRADGQRLAAAAIRGVVKGATT